MQPIIDPGGSYNKYMSLTNLINEKRVLHTQVFTIIYKYISKV